MDNFCQKWTHCTWGVSPDGLRDRQNIHHCITLDLQTPISHASEKLWNKINLKKQTFYFYLSSFAGVWGAVELDEGQAVRCALKNTHKPSLTSAETTHTSLHWLQLKKHTYRYTFTDFSKNNTHKPSAEKHTQAFTDFSWKTHTSLHWLQQK